MGGDMETLGEVDMVRSLRDSTWDLLGELIALRAEGERLRQELESWPPSSPEMLAASDLPRTFDDVPFEEDDRPTWIPDGEDRRDTVRC